MIILKKKNKAFTILELIVAVLIVGVMATGAIHAYKQQVYRMRMNEVKTVLLTIYEEQIGYRKDHGNYAFEVAGEDSVLGVEFSGFKYFQTPKGPMDPPQDGWSEDWTYIFSPMGMPVETTYIYLARIVSTNRRYGFFIIENGTIYCLEHPDSDAPYCLMSGINPLQILPNDSDNNFAPTPPDFE